MTLIRKSFLILSQGVLVADHRRVIFTMTVLGVLGLGLMFFSQRVLKPQVIEAPATPEYLTQPTSNMNNIEIQKTTAAEFLETLKSSKAKITLVNLWATWCGPCKDEIPELVKLKKNYAKKNVDIKLVSVDGLDLLPEVHLALAELKVDFLTYIRTDEDKIFIEQMYPGWSGALPASIIYGSNGKILQAWMGVKNYSEFESLIKKHL